MPPSDPIPATATRRGGRTALVWVGCALLGLAALGAWWWGRTAAMPEPNPVGSQTTTVIPGLHLIGGLGPSAAYAVETSQGIVLVDTGLGDDAQLLRSEMGKLGLDWHQVRAILLTHVHGDHTGGAEELRTSTKAKVHAGKGDADALREGGPRESFFSVFSMPGVVPHKTTIDVALEGGETLTFGDTTFRAIAAPGHTPGSICYLMERAGVRALFAGDVVTMLVGDGGTDPMALKPLGTYSAHLSPKYRGDAKETLATLRMLRDLPVPDLVLPGHPGSDPVPQNPRLSADRWREMIDAGISELDALIANLDADGPDYLDGTPRRLLPDLFYLGDFGGQAVYALAWGSRIFLFDAPGGAGLSEFVAERLRGLGVRPEIPSSVLLTSVNARSTAGLKALVETTHAEVIAPRAGLDAARALCPPDTALSAAEDLPARSAFEVRVIPLKGRGLAPVAYVIPWAGKTVLISGRIPILFDDASIQGLAADLGGSRDRVMEYLDAIHDLDRIKPDLWLPAVPSNGQNANVYEDEWRYVIENNYRAGYSRLQATK